MRIESSGKVLVLVKSGTVRAVTRGRAYVFVGMRWLLAAALLLLPAAAQNLPNLYHDEAHGDPPFLMEEGWRTLLNGKDLSGWHGLEGQANQWFTARGVIWKRIWNPNRLTAKAEPGDRIMNGKDGRTANLISDEKFSNFELYAEFMLAKGSNSGIFLHGLYEVQIFDSYGYAGPLKVGDCGGIYEREDGGGSAPALNASRAPGEWQSLRIWFEAPHFDASGRKTANAKVWRVMLNELPVQENVEVRGPTVSHLNIPEAASNPLMLQGDHGPVAFRNVYIRQFDPPHQPTRSADETKCHRLTSFDLDLHHVSPAPATD